MRVERITPETLEIVRGWWRERGDGEVPDSALPPLGAVAINGSGETLAAAWLYQPSACDVVILDWLVSRPGLDQASARAACRAVCRELVHVAALDGKRHVFASVSCDAMLREARNFGFAVAATACTHLVKHL